MNTVRLMTCDNAVEANLIKGKLENEDIPCILTNENFSNLMPHYNRIMGAGVQVLVNEEDFNRAMELVNVNPEVHEITCPNCNSKNIKVGLGKQKFKKVFAIVVSLLTVIPINNISYSYTCKDCKTEF